MQTFLPSGLNDVEPSTILGYVESDGNEGFNEFGDIPVRHEDRIQQNMTVISLYSCEGKVWHMKFLILQTFFTALEILNYLLVFFLC